MGYVLAENAAKTRAASLLATIILFAYDRQQNNVSNNNITTNAITINNGESQDENEG